MEVKLKNATLTEWEDWLNEELTEPVKVCDESKYVLEAFKEAVQLIKSMTNYVKG